MIRNILALSLLAAAGGAQVANATDGSVNFNGSVIAETCLIAVNGMVSPLPGGVTLPTVSTARLATAAQVQGATGFQIRVAGCTGPANTVATFFESSATVDAVSGNLKNTTGTAQNVQLQLLDVVTGLPIKAGDTAQKSNNTRSTLVPGSSGNSSAVMNYGVQYYATGATTPGSVVGQVTYNLDYQ
ncbi:fimbrial protein [Pseudomonas sp. L1(2025)]|uniref:fimbrial protein n=1 Tax=Pseudomonas sp. L1(2025) TaxID=3449429 RepID=UPI003F68C814